MNSWLSLACYVKRLIMKRKLKQLWLKFHQYQQNE